VRRKKFRNKIVKNWFYKESGLRVNTLLSVKEWNIKKIIEKGYKVNMHLRMMYFKSST